MIRALEARGLDVTNAVDAGRVSLADREQLEYSTAEGRVLFTYNMGDFLSLHAELVSEGRPHGGLIVAPQQRYSVGEQMRRVLRISRKRTSEEMISRVEFLSAWDSRTGT